MALFKKKKDEGFKPEENVEVKRQRLKETYIMEGIVITLLILYLMFTYEAYMSVHPRADFSEVMEALPSILGSNPLYFWPISGYSVLPGIGLALLVDMFILLGYTYGKLRVHSNSDTLKGRSYWESAKKLADKYAEFIEKKGLLPWMKTKDMKDAYDNIIMSKNLYVSLNTKKHFHALNTLILGVSGSGKTRFWLKPNLMQMNSSFAITDPKGEILESCGEILRRNGYDVKVFDIVEQKNCNTYNPLKYCRKESDIKKVVQSFMKNTDPNGGKGGGNKDPFWDDATSAFLCACIALLVTKPEDSEEPYAQIPEVMGGSCYEACFPNLCEFARMANKKWTPTSGIDLAEGVALGDGKNNTANCSELAAIFENLRVYECKRQGYALDEIDQIEKPYCLREWENFRIAPEKTSTTILMTTAVKLDAFNIEQIKNLTASDTMCLDDFATRKTALFLIMPATDRTYNFLLAFLYTQLFDILYQFGEKRVDGSKSLKLPNGELVKWFSREEVEEGGIDDKIKIIKNAKIEREELNGMQHGTAKVNGKKKKISFDDAVFNIVSADGEIISRRPTKTLAEEYLNDLQNAELKKGRVPALPMHFRFLIDEFPNIGEIPEFKEKLATMRGYEISATVICQSITQLKGMYPDDYEVVDANCPFLVFLGGDENSNNEYLAKKLGNTTSTGMNNSVDNKKVNVSYNKDQQALMYQEDIGRIPYNKTLVFIYGEQPLYDDKWDVVDHKNFKMSREYFHDNGMDCMEFKRDIYKMDETVVLKWTGSRIRAIPDVTIGNLEEFTKALKSFLSASTDDKAVEKANANLERFSFENNSVAMAF